MSCMYLLYLYRDIHGSFLAYGMYIVLGWWQRIYEPKTIYRIRSNKYELIHGSEQNGNRASSTGHIYSTGIFSLGARHSEKETQRRCVGQMARFPAGKNPSYDSTSGPSKRNTIKYYQTLWIPPLVHVGNTTACACGRKNAHQWVMYRQISHIWGRPLRSKETEAIGALRSVSFIRVEP